MKLFIQAAAVTAALAIMPFTAFADQRYATPPPIVISPDLTSAWSLQITPRHTTKTDKSRVSQKRNNTARSGVVTASIQRKNTALRQTNTSDFNPDFLPQIINFDSKAKPGTLIVNTVERRLYLVLKGGKARRYAIGVGRPGFEWTGTNKVSRKAEWPSWRPPAEMIERESKKGINLPKFMKGGIENPLGARALYLGSTIYRIHGTNQIWSIGKAVSSGCIRMRNEDVMDLYDRVPVGAKVKVI